MPRPVRAQWPRWARVLTSGWVMSPLLVFALLVGAFLGYGAYTRSKPTHYDRGGSDFAAGEVVPGVAASGKPKGRPSARPSRPAGSAPTAAGSGGNAATAIGSGGKSVPGGSDPGGGAAPDTHRATVPGGPVMPAVGRYGLAVSGSENVKFGPFAACRNRFPSHAVLGIAKAAGESPTSYDFDLRLYPNQANRHDERHIYRFTRGGIFLDYEQATVTCSGIKQASAVEYDPGQLRVDLPLQVGAQWRNDGGDSDRREAGTSRITGTEVLHVDGHAYTTYVIETTLSMSGSESGSRLHRWWWSPTLGVPLKWHEEQSGSRSGATYKSNMTCTVTDLP